jgi:hypothetical protein
MFVEYKQSKYTKKFQKIPKNSERVNTTRSRPKQNAIAMQGEGMKALENKSYSFHVAVKTPVPPVIVAYDVK